MLFVPLGSTASIGANSYFLKIDQTGIVLDAGADPDEEGPAALPRFEHIQRHADRYVDHAIVTHAHHDHIGALPSLIQQFPHVLVHMTKATRDLIDLLLPASARLQRRKLREGSSVHEPLFSEEELEVYSYLYLAHETGDPFDVTGIRGGTKVKAQFFDAGHILGSAGVLLAFEENGVPRRLFYTSDTNVRPQTIIPGAEYPEGPVDVLVLESTLGADPNAEQTTRRTEEKKLGEAIGRVLARGGTVLLPVFALGRAQEILALLDRYKQRGLVPAETPIYTAGSMRAVADLYDRTRFNTPRLNPDFQVFGVEQRRLPRGQAGKDAALAEPSIHVVASGMMFERTLSNQLATQLLEHERNGIFLVGFAKEDSPADRLLEAAAQGPGTEVVVDPQVGPQVLRAEVQRFRFSGHSHRRDLLQVVEQLTPKKIILVHGEEAAQTWMEDNIRFFYPDVEIFRPSGGEALEV